MDPNDKPAPSSDIHALIAIMAALRTPQTGCPWDLEQNFATIAPYTIEEAYEVADAIERQDFADSDVKPAGIPINIRPPFRFEAGHDSNQLPAGFRH